MDKKYCHELAQILMCPKSKKPLKYDDNLHAFVNKENNTIYHIEEGIPILLDEETCLSKQSAKEVEKKESKEENIE